MANIVQNHIVNHDTPLNTLIFGLDALHGHQVSTEPFAAFLHTARALELMPRRGVGEGYQRAFARMFAHSVASKALLDFLEKGLVVGWKQASANPGSTMLNTFLGSLTEVTWGCEDVLPSVLDMLVNPILILPDGRSTSDVIFYLRRTCREAIFVHKDFLAFARGQGTPAAATALTKLTAHFAPAWQLVLPGAARFYALPRAVQQGSSFLALTEILRSLYYMTAIVCLGPEGALLAVQKSIGTTRPRTSDQISRFPKESLRESMIRFAEHNATTPGKSGEESWDSLHPKMKLHTIKLFSTQNTTPFCGPAKATDGLLTDDGMFKHPEGCRPENWDASACSKLGDWVMEHIFRDEKWWNLLVDSGFLPGNFKLSWANNISLALTVVLNKRSREESGAGSSKKARLEYI
ncbi:hypothetical protein FB45DRAFT_1006122 [Roridomyces roridus]|uniref:Uncharacterized protein n=1 Tax=Roridomyces roridus TaxID=1738132 RepID=A0AAD7BI50_9AGAR|nr:hypothetical protein FB45DRAFT_1006122 [Roridomyces roridus]